MSDKQLKGPLIFMLTLAYLMGCIIAFGLPHDIGYQAGTLQNIINKTKDYDKSYETLLRKSIMNVKDRAWISDHLKEVEELREKLTSTDSLKSDSDRK